jgi:hypothetical protein
MNKNIPRITKDQFNLWWNSPVADVVREYLKSYQQALRYGHLERWENGNAASDPDFEQRARGVILFVNEFLQLEFSEIEKAYTEGENEE